MAKYCPVRGTELQIESDKVCPSCGARVLPPVRAGFFRSPAPRWALILIGIFAIVLVFLGMNAFLFVRAGFFSHEAPEGMEVPVYGCVPQPGTRLVILGDVTGRAWCTGGSCQEVNFVEFTLGLEPGGEPVDMNGVMLSLGNGTSPAMLEKASPP